MRIFLSWSGTKSHEVALILKEWIPLVIQSVDTYVSSEDIDKGTRWSLDIAKELETCSYGIICVTKENINSPWVNFEAGALSKFVSESFVSPFLLDIKKSEVSGPLLQFQATSNEKDDVKKLLNGINKACGERGLSENRLDNIFDAMWPLLQSKLELTLKQSKEPKSLVEEEPGALNDRMLEEILNLVRSQQKILNSPEDLIPKEYFSEHISHLFTEVSIMLRSSKEAHSLRTLSQSVNRTLRALENAYEKFPSEKINELNRELLSPDIITQYLEEIKMNQYTVLRHIDRYIDELQFLADKLLKNAEYRLVETPDRWTNEIRQPVSEKAKSVEKIGVNNERVIRRVPINLSKD
ncbi:TIR domain-containing protein [Mesobacillus maritimus]|uniref:TIR domain-containing protein n=1 Tax=Mesobacillus maritimus TaxID=1643336 RepID=UPI00203A5801|nr:TIR domain-containing protein [Mesobacillus maritimus]MCM3667912.1 TIR domain-containing protein [Mesobacillus maritimus]